jgi:uncharacterized protein (UPF0264 family)
MAKLLVSVRDAAEALMASQEGVDLVDIKNPDRGSLGAADAATIDTIARQLAGNVPLSVALGELAEGNQLSPALAGRVAYAKFGLAGCSRQADWPARWEAAIQNLPPGVIPVAVAYADWRCAAAPDPLAIIGHAVSLGCGALLLDTYCKGHDNLLHHCKRSELQQLLAMVQRAGMLSVLAGSLGPREILTLLPLLPDYVAVRGAACAGPRTAHLDRQRLRELVALVHTTDHAVAGAATTTG